MTSRRPGFRAISGLSSVRPAGVPASRALAALAAVLTSLPAAATLAAATIEVQIVLPVRARLDLAGRDSIATAPCITVDREGEGRAPGREVDAGKEFSRYLRKLLRRDTELKLVETGPLDYPTLDLDLLGRDRDFWRALGERTQADLILGCSLDFDVTEASGYRSEKYTSPYDGEVYRRQTLVEESGFEFDVVLQVYDGRTGEQLVADNFKDFKERGSEAADPMGDLFENLYAVEDKIAGIFSQGKVEATRVLFLEESAAE